MPQRILDERRTKVNERIERRCGILGQDEPTWISENAEGLVGLVSIGSTRDNDTDIPLQLFALSVRAGYWGTGVDYALFEQAIGDRAASLWVLANNERRSRLVGVGSSIRRDRPRPREGSSPPETAPSGRSRPRPGC
jgi:hypothetical protein